MSLKKIINTIKSVMGLILFGYFKSSGAIPIFGKKLTIDDYKTFLRRTTIDNWDELKKPSFVDGFVDEGPSSNTKIYSDLNYNDKFPITLIQKKEEFEFWIDFEQKVGVIDNIIILTGNNFRFVIYNTLITAVLISIYLEYDFNIFIVFGLISLMRLYTFLTIKNSINFLKIHLEYMLKIYSIKLYNK
jgi:hypothetical protein